MAIYQSTGKTKMIQVLLDSSLLLHLALDQSWTGLWHGPVADAQLLCWSKWWCYNNCSLTNCLCYDCYFYILAVFSYWLVNLTRNLLIKKLFCINILMLALHLQSSIIVMPYSQKSINYYKCYSFWGTPCWICINPSLFPLVWFYFKFTIHALLFFLYIVTLNVWWDA